MLKKKKKSHVLEMTVSQEKSGEWSVTTSLAGDLWIKTKNKEDSHAITWERILQRVETAKANKLLMYTPITWGP